MQQGDKLTAITLTEENGDQDFDDWDDVGLNIPKPPDLLYLFGNYSTFMLSDREKLERIKNLVCVCVCVCMFVCISMKHLVISCVCLGLSCNTRETYIVFVHTSNYRCTS